LRHFADRLGDLVKPDALSPVVHFHGSVFMLPDQRLLFLGRYDGNDWLLRTTKKFLSMRRVQKDTSSVLFGPVHSRWASSARLPYLAGQIPSEDQPVRGAVA
jgi:hypothetical protein